VSQTPRIDRRRLPATLVVLLGLAALLLSIVTAITFGPSDLSIPEVLSVLQHKLGLGPDPELSALRVATIWQLRLPRVLLAATAGAGLSLCGVIMQSLLRNPLAEPYLLGVSSGASTGAVLILVAGIGGGLLTFPAGAFVGSLAAFGATLALSRLAGGTTDKIVLAGVAVTQGFSALTSFIIMIGADANTTRGILYWLMGSFANVSWEELGLSAVTLLAFLILTLVMSGSLDAFMFGEREAATLGVSVHSTRIILLGGAALMTAVVVSSSGAVGFVGLVLPHISRLLVGSRHRRLLPTSAVLGAVFLLWADTIARTTFAPLEVPVGVITALVGVPIFAVILIRTRKR
jgi:transport system permease protein